MEFLTFFTGKCEFDFAIELINKFHAHFFQIQELFLVFTYAVASAVLLALTIEMPITNLSHHYLPRKKHTHHSTESHVKLV